MKRAALIITALIVFPYTNSSRAASEPTEPSDHPVTWFKELNLTDFIEPRPASNSQESLKNQLHMAWVDAWEIATPLTAKERSTIDNCTKLFRGEEKGFEPVYQHDFPVHLNRAALCHATKALSDAKQSNQSYIRKFNIDESTPDNLPAEMAFLLSPSELEQLNSPQNQSISDVSDIDRIDIKNKHQGTIYDNDGGAQTIKILGFGDLNDDGIEDIIIMTNERVHGGSYATTNLYNLTRLGDEQPITLLRRYTFLTDPESR